MPTFEELVAQAVKELKGRGRPLNFDNLWSQVLTASPEARLMGGTGLRDAVDQAVEVEGPSAYRVEDDGVTAPSVAPPCLDEEEENDAHNEEEEHDEA